MTSPNPPREVRTSRLFPVVTGACLLHPEGSAAELLASLNAARAGNASASADRAAADPVASLAGRFPRGSLRRMPIYARTGLAAAIGALEEAGAWPCPEQTGLVIGTFFGCQKTSLDYVDSILDDGPRLSSPTSFSHAVNNMACGLLSLMLGLKGPCMTVCNQELSFAGALAAAGAMLLTGRCERVLCGALDEADERLQAVFPDIPLSGRTAFFLCLEAGDSGIACDCAWRAEGPDGTLAVTQADGAEAALPVSALGGAALSQAAGLALGLEAVRGGARRASVRATAKHSGLSATLTLQRI
ncbi:MAG: beta-ketoacyl synthase N-terminal-like domain-containing protein [Desulfovibrionaceae bacterium]|nr:beta-ketoacyl synthase N-terminal-like domain-containing protein [Desulfovibrionaceae bacterium]